MCIEQSQKRRRGTPHQYLSKIDALRFFKGNNNRNYEEQDFQCQVCQAKFTWSSNKNDLAWTLWQG
ncbi:MAG: hypothetical protein C0615_07940 [Desulfuromonas sp.]|nr:MAG: hypothetical protein C0615_07940 [Desulfuromonas sp.]